jgi:hypothetical protein
MDATVVDMRKISRYRSPSRAAEAVNSGQLRPFRVCEGCEFRDPLCNRCVYNGVVEPGASCDFWTEES